MAHYAESSVEIPSSASANEQAVSRRAADEVSQLVVWAHRRAEADFRANRAKIYLTGIFTLVACAFAYAAFRGVQEQVPAIQQSSANSFLNLESEVKRLSRENAELRHLINASIAAYATRQDMDELKDALTVNTNALVAERIRALSDTYVSKTEFKDIADLGIYLKYHLERIQRPGTGGPPQVATPVPASYTPKNRVEAAVPTKIDKVPAPVPAATLAPEK